MNPALRLCKGTLLRNCHPSVSNHLTLSSSSKFTIFPPKHNSNLSTSSISQSLKGLENQGLQLPPFSPLAETIQTSLTQASLDATRANKEGKDSHKGVVPHHLSFQKLTLQPSPTTKASLELTRCPNFLIAFHNPTPYPCLASQELHPPLFSPYFPIVTWFQKASLSFAKYQLHLPRRALLSVVMLLTPNPPFLLSK